MARLHVLTLTVSALLVLAQAAQIRWMPLGDSITDYGCWRAWIWERFQKDGHDVNIVGSQVAGEDCNGLAFDRDQEGHPGFQATDIAAKGQLVDWLKQNPAAIVTMHLGTVDILRGMLSGLEVLTALGKLVDQMRDSNPAMRIIVAQLIPLPAMDSEVREFNAAIPGYFADKNSTASPIWVVDQWTNFTSADLYDGIHPSASGDVKIADRFYPALVGAIQSIQGELRA
ncbi:SGNH hydrolase-type esterase domain-containing protein [Chaetomium fimeti]|uniref:SGNH hydrolase-type esterase domain-containing protein n=1 Tax=Chaetomium fimeti TaxID=1854472 RepID=A0AAE0HP81_9PEZI|nr:SGNH hydrolase-type esterase domain-containing protein [Chaetomium fimeti]